MWMEIGRNRDYGSRYVIAVGKKIEKRTNALNEVFWVNGSGTISLCAKEFHRAQKKFRLRKGQGPVRIRMREDWFAKAEPKGG